MKKVHATEKWVSIKTVKDLGFVFQKASETPVIFFKHSTRCSISNMAFSRLDQEELFETITPAYYIDVLLNRDVSNAISERTKIFHESPQAIIIFKEAVVYAESHSNIRLDQIVSKIKLLKSA